MLHTYVIDYAAVQVERVSRRSSWLRCAICRIHLIGGMLTAETSSLLFVTKVRTIGLAIYLIVCERENDTSHNVSCVQFAVFSKLFSMTHILNSVRRLRQLLRLLVCGYERRAIPDRHQPDSSPRPLPARRHGVLAVLAGFVHSPFCVLPFWLAVQLEQFCTQKGEP